jgi:hypothetical protein
MVGATKADKLIIITPQEIERPEKNLLVSILTSGSTWIQCKILDTATPATNNGRITLGLSCPPNTKYFRAIKVTFIKNQAEPLEICGLSLDQLTV